MTLKEYLKQAGYSVIPDTYRTQIDAWESWYKGKVKGFHDYNIYNGDQFINCSRAQLNMAKRGCEYWADLLWNRDCFITLDDDSIQKHFDEILQRNNFTWQTNQLIEKAFALGTGAFVSYPENDKAKIDYIPVGYIFPLSSSNGIIGSCAFAGVYHNIMKKNPTEQTKNIVYLMIHEKQSDGTYMVYNKFFEMDSSKQIEEIETPKGIKPEYKSNVCRFAIITPNIGNNIDDVPLGISVYANSIDTLKSIDLAYDGMKVSMQIGRPRVGISGAALKPTADGNRNIFDSNDIAFYQLGDNVIPDEKRVIQDLTTQYRAAEFEKSLQAQLTQYSQNIGLGENTFKWEQSSVATATQVISQNSSMGRTMRKHQDGLRSAIIQISRAVLDIEGYDSNIGITVKFDDSATKDDAMEQQKAWMWVQAGKYPFWKYLVEYEGYSEDEAKELEAEAAKTNSFVDPYEKDDA